MTVASEPPVRSVELATGRCARTDTAARTVPSGGRDVEEVTIYPSTTAPAAKATAPIDVAGRLNTKRSLPIDRENAS